MAGRMKDPDGRLLEAVLRERNGGLLMRHYLATFDELVRQTPPDQPVRVWAAWAWACATFPCATEARTNDLEPSVARWTVHVRDDLRGRIEIRKEADPGWNDRRFPAPEPFVWLDRARPFRPLPSWRQAERLSVRLGLRV